MMNNAWVEKFEELISHLDSCLVSPARFTAHLKKLINSPNSPLSGAAFTIDTVSGTAIDIGPHGSGDPNHVMTIPLPGPRHYSAKLHLWFQDFREAGEPKTLTKTEGLLRQAFNAWWNPGDRSPKGDFLMWTETTRRRGQGALAFQRNRGRPYTVLFCDMDNFKKVNNTLGQTGGDVVILRIATFLEDIVADDGVIVQHGGDEFLIILPELSTQDAIELAARIVNHAGSFDFETKGTPLGLSLGIASTDGHSSACFEELVKAADEDALKALVKNDPDVKGAMRVSGTLSEPLQWARSINPLTLSLVLRCGLGEPLHRPTFVSVWLNALVITGRRAFQSTQNFHGASQEILNAFHAYRIPLGKTDVSILPYGPEALISPILSALDIVAAGARMVLEECLNNASLSDEKHLVIRQNHQKTTLSFGDETLIDLPYLSERELELDLGPTWGIVQSDKSGFGSHINSSPFILLEIGRNHLHALPKLAAAHIVIDDRPVVGGGLPDFWELSLSRLIRSLGRLPNVEQIVIFGDQKNAQQTVSRLKAPHEWDNDYISYKTSVPKTLVSRAQSRLGGKVSLFSTEEDAIESLLDIASISKTLSADNPAVDDEPDIRLRRTLDYSSVSLNPEDGCRVKSAAEAYPLMLEILRTDKARDELISDQDGQQLRELVDFKVVVEDPETDQVPWFFQREKDKLHEYFTKEFLDENGIFAKQLSANGEEDCILNHVHWALTRNDGKPFATRRSILVIPHVPNPHPEKVSPLGLVSIRILPRPTSTETVLNFSFTWRTVEALVGFPYSLYGSLQYSQHLRDKLQILYPSKPVRLGFVSYVAHSLHFFVSDESRRIARRIVSESSN